MMLVDFVAFEPPPPPPPPETLSLMPETAPLRAPAIGDPPSDAASAPLLAALPRGPPSAIPSSLSVKPPTLSVTVSSTFSPTVFNSSDDASLSWSNGSVCYFAIADQLLDL